MTIEPWLIVTPQQFKRGWCVLRDDTVQEWREFELIRRLPNGDYEVRNPKLQVLEEERRGERR
jgi:hypothetical protein